MQGLTLLGSVFDLGTKAFELEQCKLLTEAENFWQDPESHVVLKKQKYLLGIVNGFETLRQELHYLEELLTLGDQSLAKQMDAMLDELEQKLAPLEVEAMFKTKEDKMNAFLEITPGAGGVDSQDLAEMLERMYLRFGQINDFETEIISRQNDDHGIKNSIIKFGGANAYGMLRRETGIHRFVRISPFNANGKRQTSFVGVVVMPQIDDSVNVNIAEADLKIDTYRSSGAGGQHVNTTDSAVRITHKPTGLVVTCQNQRSQHQNKDFAMRVLYAKLYKLEEDKKRQASNSVHKDDISWGNQIRNYVFQPYKLVKDIRTGFETQNIDAIMDGEIKALLLECIKQNV